MAISPASKRWNNRSTSTSVAPGELLSEAHTRTVVRSCPITLAARKPRPATSPIAKPTWPSGRASTSYQSPPTPTPGPPGS